MVRTIKNGENVVSAFKKLESCIKLVETNTTYEEIGARIRFVDFEAELLGIAAKNGFGKFDLAEATKIVAMATVGAIDKVYGDYIVNDYLDAFSQLQAILGRFSLRDLESRQLVVNFKPIHCFQNIQFLIRERILHVIVSMRSCDFKNKFLTDVYIAYFMGLNFSDKLASLGYNAHQIDITMNIGSLHIYKEIKEEC